MIVNRAFCNNNKEHKQDLYRVEELSLFWFKCKGNEKSNAVILYKAVYEKPLKNKK